MRELIESPLTGINVVEITSIYSGPMAGMMLGGLAHDRIDQQAFRRVTLAVLLVAGLNLVRRAVF